jgi:hypothetical protein
MPWLYRLCACFELSECGQVVSALSRFVRVCVCACACQCRNTMPAIPVANAHRTAHRVLQGAEEVKGEEGSAPRDPRWLH